MGSKYYAKVKRQSQALAAQSSEWRAQFVFEPDVLRYHPVQAALWNDKHRFKVVTAGRRSGKTELGRRNIVRCLPIQKKWRDPLYIVAAPTHSQVRRIYWDWFKANIPAGWIDDISETAAEIRTIFGATVRLAGMDRPERTEGVPLDGLLLDEYGNMRAGAWAANLRPALADRRGWAWLIGVPEGMNHYHDLWVAAAEPENAGDWARFTWPSADILLPEEIESARRDLDPRTFRQEFEACHLPETRVRLAGGGNRAVSELAPGDALLYLAEDGNTRPCYVIRGGPTGVKSCTRLTLETGETLLASDRHALKVGGNRVEVASAKSVERRFLSWAPGSHEARLAALVAFNLGDGTVANRTSRYTKRDGHVSCYRHLQASFYSATRGDLGTVASDLGVVLGRSSPAVLFKRGSREAFDSWQIHVSRASADYLVASGCVVGKKVEQEFAVPGWVLDGGPDVRRAFVAALWGAEGSSPRIQTTEPRRCKLPALPVLKMSKRIGVDGKPFFEQLARLMAGLGVETNLAITPSVSGTDYSLYVCAGVDNLIRFFSDIGYLYADRKQRGAWLWAAYLRAYRYGTATRKASVDALRSSGTSYRGIAARLGMTRGSVWAVANRPAVRPGRLFPPFAGWLAGRWQADAGCLRLDVSSREGLDARPVCNILVSSPDHSYLLADGTLNFNSFEAHTGRVYYAFERTLDVQQFEIAPQVRSGEWPWHIGMDFNVHPMTAVAGWQNPDTGEVWVWRNYAIPSSNTEELGKKIIHDGFFPAIIHPDASGRSRHTNAAAGRTDLSILRELGFQIHAHQSNPSVRDRFNAVNTRLCTGDGRRRTHIHPNCGELIRALDGLTYKPGTNEADKTSGHDHVTDGFGYWIEYEFPCQGAQIEGGTF